MEAFAGQSGCCEVERIEGLAEDRLESHYYSRDVEDLNDFDLDDHRIGPALYCKEKSMRMVSREHEFALVLELE